MKEKMKDFVRLSFGEEMANAITHGVMGLIVLFLLPVISVFTYNKGGITYSIGASIYMICMFFMFINSMLYHIMPYDTTYKLVFRILDHSFIYFAIAGTYTPIALSLVGGIEGLVIILIQWAMVIFGVLYKSLSKKPHPKVSLVIYLVMGWTAILFIPTLVSKASIEFISFILLGGILYSIGAYFYSKKELNWSHVYWHFFIIFASIAHFIAVMFFI